MKTRVAAFATAALALAFTLAFTLEACGHAAPAAQDVIRAERDAETSSGVDATPLLDASDAGEALEASAPAPANARSYRPAWGKGSVHDRLDALRVSEDNWGSPRTFFSWTTLEQVRALRQTSQLLVATAKTNGPPSAFVTALEAASRRKNQAGALAKRLVEDPRFEKRRYAWTTGFATVLGLSLRRYGDELVTIRLRDEAWIVELAPEHEPPVVVRDEANHEIPLERAVAEANRIGAAYHVRLGKDVPARFREYVILNEAMVERWAIGTPDIDEEVDLEAALLRDLHGVLEPKLGPAPGPRALAAWTSTLPASTDPRAQLGAEWQAVIAFDNIRSVLDRARLTAMIEALDKRDRTQAPHEVSPRDPAGQNTAR